MSSITASATSPDYQQIATPSACAAPKHHAPACFAQRVAKIHGARFDRGKYSGQQTDEDGKKKAVAASTRASSYGPFPKCLYWPYREFLLEPLPSPGSRSPKPADPPMIAEHQRFHQQLPDDDAAPAAQAPSAWRSHAPATPLSPPAAGWLHWRSRSAAPIPTAPKESEAAFRKSSVWPSCSVRMCKRTRCPRRPIRETTIRPTPDSSCVSACTQVTHRLQSLDFFSIVSLAFGCWYSVEAASKHRLAHLCGNFRASRR